MIDRTRNMLRRLVRDQKGASAVEYAILAAVVGAGLVSAAGSLSEGISDAFEGIVGFMTV